MATVVKVRRHDMPCEKLLEAIGIQKIKVPDGAIPDDYAKKYDNKSNLNLKVWQDIKFFMPDFELFTPMPTPKKGDWLAEHKESGQTFKQFIGSYRGPDHIYNTIYILPVTFKEDPVPPEVLEPLCRFASIFFGMPVNVMKVKNLVGKVEDRMNDGVYQAHAGKILTAIRPMVPKDAFCVAAVTLCDIYPRDSWNFVFGLAESSGRCGIYSLARYLHSFGDGAYTQINLERDPISSILIRACKTMCHEIGHMFGLRHCIYFMCLMNGSNHLQESDSRPSFLCPVCLRKLQLACKFDIIQRYVDMRQFYGEHELKEQCDWLEKRLLALSK